MFRYLLRTDIWYEAYKHLYANNGAATKGVNEDTADGFSEAKVKRIIQELRSGNYQTTPVRRTYIAKRAIRARNVRWAFLPSQINLCRKCFAWFWKQYMSLSFWIVPTDSGRKETAALR